MTVKRSADERLAARRGGPEAVEAVVERARDDGRERQQDDDAEPERGDAEAQAARGQPGPAAATPCGGERGGAHLAVDTPASSSILAIEPFSGSNISSLTFDQPPRSSIVKRPDGVGELALVLGEDGLVHRPVAPAREALLRGLGQDVVEERLGLRRRVLRRRDVDLDLDRVVRDHVVEVLALLVGGRGLVLVGQEDVAVAGGEVLQRLAAGLVLDLDVLGDAARGRSRGPPRGPCRRPPPARRRRAGSTSPRPR